MDPLEQRVKPVEVELGRNLQTYLQRLGLLPRKPPAFRLSAPGQVDAPHPPFCPLNDSVFNQTGEDGQLD